MALWNQPRRLKEVAIRQGSQEPSVLKPNWRNFKKKRVIKYVKNAIKMLDYKVKLKRDHYILNHGVHHCL